MTSSMPQLSDLFRHPKTRTEIQQKLPQLFHIAALECSRAGKIGMEVGVLRERILVALLIYKLGESQVNTDIPTTTTEIDLEVAGAGVSIKTLSGKKLTGVKVKWTVDPQSAEALRKAYRPSCHMILVHIHWQETTPIYFIPQATQLEVFHHIGPRAYTRPPKLNTNPRG